jgi:hypothetical protein
MMAVAAISMAIMEERPLSGPDRAANAETQA